MMVTKRFFTTLALIIGLIVSSVAQVGVENKTSIVDNDDKLELSKGAVENMSKTPHFAMGVSTARRLQNALMMFETLKDNKVEFEKYEILVWDKVVSELKEGSEWHKMFKEALDDKRLTVSVCAFAMKKLKVDEKELIPGMTPVPDAFLRVYELQALGYNVLIP